MFNGPTPAPTSQNSMRSASLGGRLSATKGGLCILLPSAERVSSEIFVADSDFVYKILALV